MRKGLLVLAAVTAALARGAFAADLPKFGELTSRFGLDASAVLAAPQAVKPKPKPAPPGSSPSAPSVSFHGKTFPAYIFTGRGAGVSAQIAAAIDAADRTVDASLYTLTLQDVTDALVRAKGRGVTVRVGYDFGHAAGAGGTGSQPGVSGASPQLNALVAAKVDVRVLRGSGPYGIMHNKFLIVDGGLVETGSYNWTTAAEKMNHENALFRTDASLIADYQSYFDWMWAQAGPLGGEARQPSGAPPACADGPSALGRTWPQCAFSPAGPTEDLLAEAIARAKTRVHIAMFSFTSPAVVAALIDAKKRGVELLLVFDRQQSRTETSLQQLKDAGVAYKLGAGQGGGAGVLHDKFGLFDDLLETGSFNYTTNASKNNFENAFFSSTRPDLDGYEAEFQALYAEGAAAL